VTWLLAPLAFAAELVDSSLGMGYGTNLVPILLLLGYSPAQVVPAVLFSELLTGFWAAHWHGKVRNVEWRGAALKVALLLGGLSIFGAVFGVFAAEHLSGLTIRAYIAGVVILMGLLILFRKRRAQLSWKGLSGLGIVAAFNKAVSGGGYGPLVTSGQVNCGVPTKQAIAVTSLAEGFTCFVGLVAYLIAGQLDASLFAPLVVGALASVPFSAWIVRRLPERAFTCFVGVAVLILGLVSLWKEVIT